MANINQQPHEMVLNDRAFLFTKRNLKPKFPYYFIDEDTTYFFNRNGSLEVLHVFGDKCVAYENMDKYSLVDLRRRDGFIHKNWMANTMQ